MTGDFTPVDDGMVFYLGTHEASWLARVDVPMMVSRRRFARAMRARGIRCHGFGCKEGAIRNVGSLLASADSLAWSKGGKQRGTCTHLKSRCANHLHWALAWRDSVLDAPHGGTAQVGMAL